ncbi:hypothetical protein K458DRAFT_434965 [Lentithecium fluviatile CBS 122367]|uniref:Uncharacterized protein n=1 Tax=Lentithecium fluviatile CBS 122367 TaxID=1168545 RepID=A0A6G1INT0_9PLEO|nr:hypothetical protein K458DRAFT_434965 [Lentithecium fluviatile CBS 122367]
MSSEQETAGFPEDHIEPHCRDGWTETNTRVPKVVGDQLPTGNEGAARALLSRGLAPYNITTSFVLKPKDAGDAIDGWEQTSGRRRCKLSRLPVEAECLRLQLADVQKSQLGVERMSGKSGGLAGSCYANVRSSNWRTDAQPSLSDSDSFFYLPEYSPTIPLLCDYSSVVPARAGAYSPRAMATPRPKDHLDVRSLFPASVAQHNHN